MPGAVFQSLVTALVLSRLDYCNSMLVVLVHRQHLTQRLQSVQNAAARLIFGIYRSEHIIDALIFLCLFVRGCILFKVAALTYRAHLHTCCHASLALLTCHLTEDSGPQLPTSLLSAVRLITVNKRVFPVAGAYLWNDLLAEVTSIPTLAVFRKRLKTQSSPFLSRTDLVLLTYVCCHS